MRLTATAPSDQDVVETSTVETGVFSCRLSGVHERRRVPGAVASS